MATTFTSRSLAFQWAKTASKEGRIYIVVFGSFLKIGASQDFKNRFYALLMHWGRDLPVESVTVGNPTWNYRDLERAIHLALIPFRLPVRVRREWYKRSPELESALLAWIETGYAPDQFAVLEGLALLEEQRQQVVKSEPAGEGK